MRQIRLILKVAVVVAALFIGASLAQAQQRTFVSGLGSDANNCLRATPCRGFQRAHDVVLNGGEVVALDSAGYAPFTITKSVTITGAGVHAAVTTTGATNGITINAPSATVTLRELTVTGLNGTGTDGIAVTDATTVYIERCVVTNFASNGIDYRTNNRLFVTDTVVRSNGGDGLLVTAPAGGTARINVDGSRFERNGDDGIHLNTNTIEASITNSIMSENGGSGLEIDSGGDTRAQVSHSTAANNGSDGFSVSGTGVNQLNIEYSVARGNTGNGMVVANGDTIRVSNSVATNNVTGFNNAGGTFRTRGNNTVEGNIVADLFTLNGAITPISGR